jgi:hypothetical protein
MFVGFINLETLPFFRQAILEACHCMLCPLPLGLSFGMP